MHRLPLLLLPALLLIDTADARTWTNDQGQTLEAEFVRLRGTTAMLRGEDGKLVKAPVARLGEEDQKWVEAYRDLVRPREWGTAQPPTRGRYETLEEGGVSVAAAGGSVVVPFGKLTTADIENLQALYLHLERELPAALVTAQRKAEAAGPPEDAPEREWLSVSGKKIVARYGGPEDGKAVLWIGAKRFNVSLAKLSPADQRWIAQENLMRLVASAQKSVAAAGELGQAAQAKALEGGGFPPAMLAPDPRQAPTQELAEPVYDAGYPDPTATDPASVTATEAAPGGESAYQASESPVEASPPAEAAVDVTPDETTADPAAGSSGRGAAPWIAHCDELDADEYDRRLDEAFASYPAIDYDDPHADVYCSHCEGEYVVPVGYTAGKACPLCGVPLVEGSISLLSDNDSSGSSSRPWYMRRWLRQLVIGTVVLVIGVGVKLARSGILGGNKE